MDFNNTSESAGSNSIQISKKWISVGIPLFVVLLIALAIGGYFIWLELSYETEDAELLIEEAIEHYQSALHNAQNAYESILEVEQISEVQEGDDPFMDRTELALMQEEMNSTKDSISFLNADLSEYREKLDKASELKLKDDYQTYLSMLYDNADALDSYSKTVSESFTNFDYLSIAYGLSINFYGQWLLTELSYDPDVLYNQVYQQKQDFQKQISNTQLLVDSGVLEPVAVEVDVFIDRYLNKWIEFAEAYKAGNYNGAIRVLDEMEAEYYGPHVDDLFKRSSQSWNSSWKRFFSELSSDMEDTQKTCTDSEEEAEDYYNENLR